MRKNIAIIMGGYSSEVEISLKSGNIVYQNMPKEKYNSYRVHILKNKWVALDDFETYESSINTKSTAACRQNMTCPFPGFPLTTHS